MQKAYFDNLTILKNNESYSQTMLYTSVGNRGKYGSVGYLRYSIVKHFIQTIFVRIRFSENKKSNNICSFNQRYFTQGDFNPASNTY